MVQVRARAAAFKLCRSCSVCIVRNQTRFDLSIQLSQANQPFRLNEQLLLWFLLQLWIEEPQLFRHLYDLTDENGGVVRRLHEDGLRDNFAIMEGLSAQACLSQAACIDQFKHLEIGQRTRLGA